MLDSYEQPEGLQHCCKPRTAGIDAKKILLSYPNACFDKEKYASWLNKEFGVSKSKVRLLYDHGQHTFHVRVYADEPFRARSGKRFRYDNIVPEVRTLDEQAFAYYSDEMNRLDIDRIIEEERSLARVDYDDTHSTSLLPWQEELRKELNTNAVPGPIIWYVDSSPDDTSRLFFCELLQEMCGFKYLHVLMNTCYCDLYECIEIARNRDKNKIWDGTYLLLDLQFCEPTTELQDTLVQFKDKLATRIVVMGGYTPYLTTEQRQQVVLREVNARTGKASQAKGKYYELITSKPDYQEEQEESDVPSAMPVNRTSVPQSTKSTAPEKEQIVVSVPYEKPCMTLFLYGRRYEIPASNYLW
jgi:hypothetical protein